MARLFDDASSQYVFVSSAVVSSTPFTMACFFRSDDATILQTLMSVTDTAGDVNYHSLQVAGAVAGDPIRAVSTATTGAVASTTTGYTANQWHHAAGVWTSATSRAVLIDGGSKGTDATSKTPAGIDTTSIGCRAGAIPAQFTSGRIAEAGIWNAALKDAEILALANGASPLRIRPANLLLYVPLYGTSSPEPNFAQGGSTKNMTLSGTPTQANHCPYVQMPFGYDLGYQGNFTAVAGVVTYAPTRMMMGMGI